MLVNVTRTSGVILSRAVQRTHVFDPRVVGGVEHHAAAVGCCTSEIQRQVLYADVNDRHGARPPCTGGLAAPIVGRVNSRADGDSIGSARGSGGTGATACHKHGLHFTTVSITSVSFSLLRTGSRAAIPHVPGVGTIIELV